MSAQQLGFLETLLGITTTVVNGKRTLLLCCRTFAAEYSFVSKQMTLTLALTLALTLTLIVPGAVHAP